MGGNALKDTKTRRYQKEEFIKYANQINDDWPAIFNRRVEVIRWYGNKETFGDIDVIMERVKGIDIIPVLDESIGFDEIRKNGDIISINYNKDLQCDIIMVPPEEFDFARVFYSYNDLGLLIGRMVRPLRLTYGFDSLCVKLFSDDHSAKLGKIVLSKDPKKVYESLGLDFSKWEAGFLDLVDVFEFVSASPFFYIDIFSDSLQNSVARHRDSKRKNLRIFQEWLDKNRSKFKEGFRRFTEEELFDFCDEYYPEVGIRKEFEGLRRRYRNIQEASLKFNGNLIMERYPELQGKKLGEVVSEFKYFSTGNGDPEVFLEFLLKTDQETIFKLFNLFYKEMVII